MPQIILKFIKKSVAMETFSLQHYLSYQDKVISAFFEGVTGIKFTDEKSIVSKQTRYQIGYALETVQSLANPKSVLLLSFLCNLVQTMISGSKTGSKINGKISASGG